MNIEQIMELADDTVCAATREGFVPGGFATARAALESALREALAPQEPVAFIQRDHLQKAQSAPFLCRVEPTQRFPDLVPVYAQPVAAHHKENP